MKTLRNFLLIVAAAMGSSAVGGLFGALVAWISPEFVRGLVVMEESDSLVRYAAGLGMIWGIFLGAGTMAFSLAIAAVIKLAKALDGRSSEQ